MGILDPFSPCITYKPNVIFPRSWGLYPVSPTYINLHPYIQLVSGNRTAFITRPFCLLFTRWFVHLYFGLGRGSITPPSPAMFRTDQKDLNSNKTNKWNLYFLQYSTEILEIKWWPNIKQASSLNASRLKKPQLVFINCVIVCTLTDAFNCPK